MASPDGRLQDPERGTAGAVPAGGARVLVALVALVGLAGLALAAAARLTAPVPDASAMAVTAEGRLDGSALQAARAAVADGLEADAYPGAAVAVGVGARVELLSGNGSVGRGRRATRVSPTATMYDLASMTKAVATTVAVLLLVEDGRIELDEPVRGWLPEFEGRFKDEVTWRHLLTHTAGLPAGAAIRGDDPEERLRRLLRTMLDVPPGTEPEYTDLGFLVLWAAAERAAGEPLEDFLARRVWRPLGMSRTRFSPGAECEACAPTLRLRDGTPFRGLPHDLYSRRLGGIAGNAGLFSTARDMGRLAALIANGGEVDGVRILRPETLDALFRQQPGAGRRTLGWRAFCPEEPPDAEVACELPVAYGHTGYTGTSLWVDPHTGVWVVLLTNRTYDVVDPEAMEAIDSIRTELWRAVLTPPRALARTPPRPRPHRPVARG